MQMLPNALKMLRESHGHSFECVVAAVSAYSTRFLHTVCITHYIDLFLHTLMITGKMSDF